MLVDLGAPDEFPEERFKIVSVDGHQVGVTRWRGKLYALANICPDQSGPLCKGEVGPFVDYEEGGRGVIVDEDKPVVICPWHAWQFDLATGHGMRANARAKTFRVVERGGRVLVDVPK